MKIKIIGAILLVISIIILLILPSIINPLIGDGSMDSAEYYLRMGINAVRFMMLAGIFSTCGIKLLTKKLKSNKG